MSRCQKHGEVLWERPDNRGELLHLYCLYCEIDTHFMAAKRRNPNLTWEECQCFLLPHAKRLSEEAERLKSRLRRRYAMEAGGVEDVDGLTGLEFEECLQRFFEVERGYSVVRTPGSGDMGIDLVLSDGLVRVGVQCKRYSDNVGVEAVQAVNTGRQFYTCDKALVITTAGFTPKAKILADKVSVELWDRQRLGAELDKRKTRTTWAEYLQRWYK